MPEPMVTSLLVLAAVVSSLSHVAACIIAGIAVLLEMFILSSSGWDD